MLLAKHTDPPEIRRRAEKRFFDKSLALLEKGSLSGDELKRLFHELQNHQVELELQNEELRHIQAELQQSRDKYSRLYNHVPVGCFTLDLRGNILEANATGIAQLGCSEPLPKKYPWKSFIEKQSLKAFIAQLKASRETGEKNVCELTMITADRRKFDAHVEIVTAAEDSNRIDRILVAITDISGRVAAEEALREGREQLEETVGRRTAELADTNEKLREEIAEHKRTEEQLEKALEDLAVSNSELAQFAYVASHDLQEPLRNVTSCIQLLERRFKDQLGPEAGKFIGFAVESTRRMMDLIEGLLNYCRVGNRGKDFKKFDCNAVLEQALQNLRLAILEHAATVTYDSLPIVFGDRIQITQVFQNLIGNAIRFRSEEPPRIHVSAKKRGLDWLISMSDNGIGIPPEGRERIFSMFQRLHTSREYSGTGIGLAIAKRIVERHHGRIWADSGPEGGATFYFTIPVTGVGA